MSRPTRVPYHQNVYDLLGLDPRVAGMAERMIREHEAEHGPLPAALREWYLVPGSVLLPRQSFGTDLWNRCAGDQEPIPLRDVLAAVAARNPPPPTRGRRPPDTGVPPPGPAVRVVNDVQNVYSWWLVLDGTDDPPVWGRDDAWNMDEEWGRVAPSFSEFVWNWAAHSLREHVEFHRGRVETDHPFPAQRLTGRWAAYPATPYPVPVEDYLTERFGDPDAVPTTTGARRLTYRVGDGMIRLTADAPGHPTPHAAWWVSAEKEWTLRRLKRELKAWGVPVADFRKPGGSYTYSISHYRSR